MLTSLPNHFHAMAESQALPPFENLARAGDELVAALHAEDNLRLAIEFSEEEPSTFDQQLSDRVQARSEALATLRQYINEVRMRTSAANDDRAALPLDIVLFCPKCGHQHIDEPSADGKWTNPPHRSHLCRLDDGGCGHVWRPADVGTNGVRALRSQGSADSPVATPLQRRAPAELTDVEIIAIRQSTRAKDPTQKWGDTLALVRAAIRAHEELNARR